MNVSRQGAEACTILALLCSRGVGGGLLYIFCPFRNSCCFHSMRLAALHPLARLTDNVRRHLFREEGGLSGGALCRARKKKGRVGFPHPTAKGCTNRREQSSKQAGARYADKRAAHSCRSSMEPPRSGEYFLFLLFQKCRESNLGSGDFVYTTRRIPNRAERGSGLEAKVSCSL